MGTTAVFLGTFDPVHNGHVEVIREAARVFDRLVVLLNDGNPEKEKSSRLFSVDDRLEFLRNAAEGFTNVEVVHSTAPPAHYARSIGAAWLVRGLRDVHDAASEIGFSNAMRSLDESVRVVWFRSYSASSSTELKRRARAGESLDGLCTDEVARALSARLGPERPEGLQ